MQNMLDILNINFLHLVKQEDHRYHSNDHHFNWSRSYHNSFFHTKNKYAHMYRMWKYRPSLTKMKGGWSPCRYQFRHFSTPCTTFIIYSIDIFTLLYIWITLPSCIVFLLFSLETYKRFIHVYLQNLSSMNESTISLKYWVNDFILLEGCCLT